MGWAKYYEDNISIYEGRLAGRIYEPYNERRKELPVKFVKDNPQNISFKRDNKSYVLRVRRGLKLSFQSEADEKIIRKLQLNGWWWSKSFSCWCNCDTSWNREYAGSMRCYGAILTVAVC